MEDGTASSHEARRAPRKGRASYEESFGHEERERPIVIPLVVGIVPVGVDPTTIVVAIRVEHARAAVGACEMPSAPPPFDYSQGCIVFGIAMP